MLGDGAYDIPAGALGVRSHQDHPAYLVRRPRARAHCPQQWGQYGGNSLSSHPFYLVLFCILGYFYV